MNGKSKCKILKDIRRKIARENDIEYVTSECKFQGNCSGTCPKCEAEVRYLEEELKKRQKAGKAVAVAGIAAAMVVTAAGCDLFESRTAEEAEVTSCDGEVTVQETTQERDLELDGVIPDAMEITEPTGEVDALWGRIYRPEVTEDVLTGDVAWPD